MFIYHFTRQKLIINLICGDYRVNTGDIRNEKKNTSRPVPGTFDLTLTFEQLATPASCETGLINQSPAV